mgnify:CR=1 FL=1
MVVAGLAVVVAGASLEVGSAEVLGAALVDVVVSVLEVLDAVDRVTNRTIERRIEGRRAGDPASLVSDNRRIKATLPWQPRFADLDTIVAHALAWERKLGELRGEG